MQTIFPSKDTGNQALLINTEIVLHHTTTFDGLEHNFSKEIFKMLKKIKRQFYSSKISYHIVFQNPYRVWWLLYALLYMHYFTFSSIPSFISFIKQSLSTCIMPFKTLHKKKKDNTDLGLTVLSKRPKQWACATKMAKVTKHNTSD